MKTLLIDCPFLCHRAIHTMNALTYENQSTGIIYAFLVQITSLSKLFKTRKFIFCWDSKESKRKELYPGYKAKRKENKEELEPEDLQVLKNGLAQFTKLREIVIPSLGFRNNFMVNGYEADDIMAIISMYYDLDFMMVTADEDMYQILDFTDMYNPNKKIITTYDNFVEQWGITPEQWIDVKQIAGCKSDEVPGIPGIGEKKAIQYLRKEMNTKTKTYQKIRSAINGEICDLERDRKLVELPFEGLDISSCLLKNDQPDYNTFLRICKDYGFKSFLTNDSLASIWEYIFMGKTLLN